MARSWILQYNIPTMNLIARLIIILCVILLQSHIFLFEATKQTFMISKTSKSYFRYTKRVKKEIVYQTEAMKWPYNLIVWTIVHSDLPDAYKKNGFIIVMATTFEIFFI